jgi:hypothetical protein
LTFRCRCGACVNDARYLEVAAENARGSGARTRRGAAASAYLSPLILALRACITSEPHTALDPQTALEPHTALVLEGAEAPQTAELPQIAELPHTADWLPTKTLLPRLSQACLRLAKLSQPISSGNGMPAINL